MMNEVVCKSVFMSSKTLVSKITRCILQYVPQAKGKSRFFFFFFYTDIIVVSYNYILSCVTAPHLCTHPNKLPLLVIQQKRRSSTSLRRGRLTSVQHELLLNVCQYERTASDVVSALRAPQLLWGWPRDLQRCP